MVDPAIEAAMRLANLGGQIRLDQAAELIAAWCEAEAAKIGKWSDPTDMVAWLENQAAALRQGAGS